MSESTVAAPCKKFNFKKYRLSALFPAQYI